MLVTVRLVTLLALVTLEAGNTNVISDASIAVPILPARSSSRIVLVSGANGVSIAATLVEANNTSNFNITRVNKETQGPFDPVAKIHKE